MIQAYFNNIKAEILKKIDAANDEILIAVAWFTQRDLFAAIIKALDRGVKVSIILINDIINRNTQGLNFSIFLQKGGKLSFVDKKVLLMHNKYCLFDNSSLITGSYNWTYSAEIRNAENVIITDDSVVCNDFKSHFINMWSHLDAVADYSHMSLSEAKLDDLLQEYDNIYEEFQSMNNYNIIESDELELIKDIKKNAKITQLATIKSQEEHSKPRLKNNLGMRCRIGNVNDMTLHIIEQGQVLPFASVKETSTMIDNQESVCCEIVLGNSEEADRNKSILKITLYNLPKLKAGLVRFETKVRMGINGYVDVTFSCINTGMTKTKTVHISPEFIAY